MLFYLIDSIHVHGFPVATALFVSAETAEEVAWAGAVGVAVVAGVLWRAERRRRRELERRLLQVEGRAELAEAVFDACPEGILVLDPHEADEPLAIVACNDAICKTHGWSREELVGRSVNRLEADCTRWERHTAIAALLEKMRGQRAHRGETFHRRRDGEVFPVEFSNSLITVGGREYVLGFDREISARKKAEGELRASEERFRVIIEASPVAIQLLDPHDRERPLRIVNANRRAAQMHGVDLGFFIGRGLGDFRAAPPTYETAQALLLQLKDGGRIRGEGMHRHAGGHEFPVEFSCALVTVGGRELIIESDQDIGERRRLDAELAESRRLRAVGAMVGGVAHEFNNLLTPVLLHFEQSADPASRPIRQAVEQARDLTRRILTFARKAEAAPSQSCDVTATLRECVELMAKTIDRRIQLGPVAGGSCVAKISRADLRQVLINLLLNAGDSLVEKLEAGGVAADWSPRIELAVGLTSVQVCGQAVRRVAIRVTDNGPGMSPAVKERVFEPFFTTKPAGKGTGLGLATVWHLVRSAGGEVAIESCEGAGSTIALSLPVGAIDEKAGSIEAPVAPPRESSGEEAKGDVLLVEDNEFVARAVVPMLEVGGYVVTHMKDGAEACAAILKEPGRWHRVLTDLNLPGMHGTELVRRIREAGYDRKVIAYSGLIDEASGAILRKAGIGAILQKPFALRELLDALK
ncbi:MAG TPA: PAS domain S-box protein [Rariglobus sp.]